MGEACCRQSRSQLTFPEQLPSSENENGMKTQRPGAKIGQQNQQMGNKIMPVEIEDRSKKGYKKIHSWANNEQFDHIESDKEIRKRVLSNNERGGGHRLFEKSIFHDKLQERQIHEVNKQMKITPTNPNQEGLNNSEDSIMRVLNQNNSKMEKDNVKNQNQQSKRVADEEITSRIGQRLLHGSKISQHTEQQVVKEEFDYYSSYSGEEEDNQNELKDQNFMAEENFNTNEIDDFEYEVEGKDNVGYNIDEEYERKIEASYLKLQQPKAQIGRIIFKTPEFQSFSTLPKISSFGKKHTNVIHLERCEDQSPKLKAKVKPLTISRDEKHSSDGIKNHSASQSVHAQTQMSENLQPLTFQNSISFMPASSTNLTKQNTGRFNSPLPSPENLYLKLQERNSFGVILETSPRKEQFDGDFSQRNQEQSPADSHLRSVKQSLQRHKFTFSPERMHMMKFDHFTSEYKLNEVEHHLDMLSPSRTNPSLAIVDDNARSGSLRSPNQTGGITGRTQSSKLSLLKLVTDTPFRYESLSSINDPLEDLEKNRNKNESLIKLA